MKSFPIVILGGGMVAGYAAKAMVKLPGYRQGSVLIISADADLPYERPPLSKGVLSGKKPVEKIFINPDAFYSDNGIEVMLESEALRVNPATRTLRMLGGDEIGFEKLVIATGGNPRRLRGEGENLSGTHYVRSLRDSLSLRASMQTAKTGVVVGGGFIAMEVAAVMREKGLDTTLVFPGERVWPRFFPPEISRFL